MSLVDLGLLILRLGVGGIMFAHGAQKAFGWWGGPGYAGWRAVIERMGFRPVVAWTALSTAAELLGGLFLVLGFLTPFVVAALVGQAVVIIGKAHLPRGFWNKDNGFEFPLSLAAGAVAIGLIGPGAVALDSGLGFAFGDAVRVALLVIGALGGVTAIGISRMSRPAETSEAPAPGASATR